MKVFECMFALRVFFKKHFSIFSVNIISNYTNNALTNNILSKILLSISM